MCLARTAILLSLILPAGARAQAPTQAWVLARDASRIWVVTHRAGLLSFLGHDHALVPGDWSADLCFASPVPAGAHGSIVVRVASLVIDADSARSLAGLGHGPSRSDVADIQGRILDEAHLDSASYPEIRIEAEALEAESGGRLRARGEVTMHGVTRPAEFTMAVEPADAGALRLAGTLTVRQREFGIEPESRAGVVKVADEVDLHFSLVARPVGRPCTAAAPPQ